MPSDPGIKANHHAPESERMGTVILKQRRPRYTTRDWYLFLAADKQKEINYVVEAVRKGGSENSLYRTLQSAMPYLEHGVQLDLKGALEVLKERGRA